MSTAAPIYCEGCGFEIIDAYIIREGKRYHIYCAPPQEKREIYCEVRGRYFTVPKAHRGAVWCPFCEERAGFINPDGSFIKM